MHAHAPLALTLLSLSGCAACCATPSPPPPSAPPSESPAVVEAPPAPPPSYEVHEWGLVRGNLADHVVVSGPRRAPHPIPLAKPVLYFHREGTGPLSIDVEVTLPAGGTVVEHWPLVPGADTSAQGPAQLAWRGVVVDEGTCAGARYPTPTEAPCVPLRSADGCESIELRTVETTDGDCLGYAGARWNHLFYRAELTASPSLPLELTPLGADRHRVRAHREVIGRLVRVRGTSAGVIDAPAAGEERELEVPTGSLAEGADALGAALVEAGLTADEAMAFRRAWDDTLFSGRLAASGESGTPATGMAGGLIARRTTDALLYVLAADDAEQLASLRFTPAPRRVSRAIVVWLDLAAARLAYEPPR